MDDFSGFLDESLFPKPKEYTTDDFDPRLHRERMGHEDHGGFIPSSGYRRRYGEYFTWWRSLEATERDALRDAARAARTLEQIATDNEAEARELENAAVPPRVASLIISGGFSMNGAIEAATSFVGESGMLVLSGAAGCGKTFAAGWLVHREIRNQAELSELNDSECWVPRQRPRYQFVTTARLSRMSQYDEKTVDALESVPLLIIDDVGAEYADAKGYFASMFDALINARYANQLRTVLTTNLTGRQFKERYGERIADRIREAGRFVELDSASLRGKS